MKKKNKDFEEQVDKLEKELEQLKNGIMDIIKYRRFYESQEVVDQMVKFDQGISFKKLPTNPSNLPRGHVYNDNGTLKIKQ